MKIEKLEEHSRHGLTLEGEETLADKVAPILKRLVQHLQDLPEEAPDSIILSCFKEAILSINDFEDDIETVERESILHIIYALGEVVGLDPALEYAEEWRGDW